MTARRVFLVHPPVEIFRNKIVRASFPLGICCLGTYLREKGHEVFCLDAQIEDLTRRPTSNSEKVRVGLATEEIVRRAVGFRPDIVGISCNFLANYAPSVDLARTLKKSLPGVRVVVGGSYASVIPERILEAPEFDGVVLGEGERTLERLTREPWEAIDGVAFRGTDGKVRVVPRREVLEIDALPIPDRDLLPVERYIRLRRPLNVLTKKRRVLEVMTSRGCISRCTFCSVWGLWGPFRGRSPALVLEELARLKSRYGIEEVQFVDDSLTADITRAKAIFQGMIDKDLGLSWTAPNGIALHTLDDDTIRLMRQSGCYLLVLPIESGSQRVVNQLMKKPLRLEKVPALVDHIRRQGIGLQAFFMLGMPGETFEEMKASFDMAFRLGIFKSHFNFVMPVPGTPVYGHYLEALRSTDPAALEHLSEIERDFDFKVPMMGSSAWSVEELQKFASRMMMRMYLKFLFFKPHIFISETARILFERPGVLFELLRFYGKALVRLPVHFKEKVLRQRST